jgi:hypothetical protein
MLAFGAAIGVAIGPAICGAPAALAGPAFPQAATATVPGGQLWVSTYNGPADNIDFATDAAVSPGGGTVFVTGVSDASNGSGDSATSPTMPRPARSGGLADTTGQATLLTYPSRLRSLPTEQPSS